MKSTTVIFVRHGDVFNPLGITYGRVRDVRLSEKGRRQIQQIAELIRSEEIRPAAMYVSTTRRTRETANILQDILGECPVHIRPGLLESESVNYVGRPLYGLHALGNPYLEEYQERYKYQVESERAQADRIRSVTEEAVRAHRGAHIILVSHGHPLAFGIYSLLYPSLPLLNIQELQKNGTYLSRGQAWRLEIDENFHVTGFMKISPTV